MDLKSYTKTLERGGIGDLAAKLKISTVYLSQLSARQDNREPSPELCVAIEAATDGAVTRRDLRPTDWHRIWPELVSAEHPAPMLRPDGQPQLSALNGEQAHAA